MSTYPKHQHSDKSARSSCESGSITSQNNAVHLLVPIGRAADVVYGAYYAKNLLANGPRIKVSLLHVTKSQREGVSVHSFSAGINLIEEEHAEALLKEAALHLSEHQISHCTYIISGDVVFSILDAAELLDCSEIVLPATKHRSWLRPFSSDIVGKIMQSARSVPVITVTAGGLVANNAKPHDTHSKLQAKCKVKSA